MTRANVFTGSVRLVDRKTRIVEVLGPEPPGSRYPTDRKLLYEDMYGTTNYLEGPKSVGLCIAADGRRAKFLINSGRLGDDLLDKLAKHPATPSRPARPYGVRGWLVEG